MTVNQITHKQAQALAAFIHELRGDWDTPGILDALGHARDMAPAPDLAVAAVKAAALATNRTPAVIALDGPHWRSGGESKPRYVQPSKSETCAACYLGRDECRRVWTGDHEFVPLSQPRRPSEGAELARAALREARA